MANKLRLRRNPAAIIAAVTMATEMSSLAASASGSLSRAESGSNHLIDVTYRLIVDGNSIVLSKSGSHQGRETMYGFMLNTTGTYLCTFGGAEHRRLT